MKAFLLGILTIGTLGLAAQDHCGAYVQRIAGAKSNLKSVDPELAWRAAVSHPLKGGKTHSTSAAREKQLQTALKPMIDEIFVVKDTPPMVLVPVDGAKFEFTRPWKEYSPMVAKVTGAGCADGVLRATLLLPVSGHTGLENATKWSKTDTYSIGVEDSRGRETMIVKDAKSLDFITAHDVEIPLEANKVVKVNYYRSGSGGPGGYSGGRVIEVTWEK